MELKSTFERELMSLSEKISDCLVEAKADKKLGNAAYVSIACSSGANPTDLESALPEIEGAYSFGFKLDVDA